MHSTTEKRQWLWGFRAPGKSVIFKNLAWPLSLDLPCECPYFNSAFSFSSVLQVPRLRPAFSVLPGRYAPSKKEDLQGAVWSPVNRIIKLKSSYSSGISEELQLVFVYLNFWKLPWISNKSQLSGVATIVTSTFSDMLFNWQNLRELPQNIPNVSSILFYVLSCI